MASFTKIGQNNPLWRRVTRHAAMSAVFGDASQTAVSSPLSPSLPLDTPVASPVLASMPATASAPLSRLPEPTAVSQPPAPQPTTVIRAAEADRALLVHASKMPSVPEPSREQEDPNWRRLQKIHQLHQQKTETEATPNVESIQRQPAQPAVSEGKQPNVTPQSAAAPVVPASATSQSVTSQSVPLEAAWPVRRQDDEPAPSLPKPDKAVNAAPDEPMTPTNVTQIVNEQLQQVSPGKRTDSSIDLIMPTRPRPVFQPDVQRQVAEPQMASEAEAQRPFSVSDADQPGIPMSVAPAPTPQPDQPATRMISTDIGELPADLWTLMDETPPVPALGTSDAPPPAAELSNASSSPRAAVQRQPQSEADQPMAPSTAANLAVLTPLPKTVQAKPVQRQPEPTAVSPQLTVDPSPQVQPKRMTAEPSTAISLPDRPTAVSLNPNAEPDFVQRQPEPTTVSPQLTVDPSPQVQPKRMTAEPSTAISLPDRPTAVSHLKQQDTPPTAVQQAIQQAEAPTVQRLPQMSSLETAVPQMPMFAVPDAVTQAADALTDEDKAAENEQQEDDLNIDDLSRRVYQALKRKLAVEKERQYGR